MLISMHPPAGDIHEIKTHGKGPLKTLRRLLRLLLKHCHRRHIFVAGHRLRQRTLVRRRRVVLRLLVAPLLVALSAAAAATAAGIGFR